MRAKINFAMLLYGLIFIVGLATTRNILVDPVFKHLYFSGVLFLISLAPFFSREGFTYELGLNILDILLLLYYVLCIFNLNAPYELFSNEKMTTMHCLILFYILTKINFGIFLKTKILHSFRIVLLFTSIVVFILCVWALLQYIGLAPIINSDFALTGGFTNPAHLAMYLSSLLPTIFTCVVSDSMPFKHTYIRFFSCLVFLLAVLVLAVSLNRSSWVAAITGLICIVNFKYNVLNLIKISLDTTLKRIIAICTISLIAIASCYYLYNIKADSAYGRLFRWKVIGTLIREKPILGHGFSTFPVVYNESQAKWFEKHPPVMRDVEIAGIQKYAYNEYLEVTTELGVIGLMIFCAVLIVSLRFLALSLKGLPRLNDITILFLATLISIAVLSFTSYPLSTLPTTIILFMTFSYASSCFDLVVNRPSFFGEKIPIPKVGFNLICYSFVLASFFLLMRQYRNYRAYSAWSNSINYTAFGNYNEADGLFRLLYPHLKSNGSFLVDYGTNLLLVKKYKESLGVILKAKRIHSSPKLYESLGDNYTQLNRYKNAEEAYKRASYMQPIRFTPKYSLMKLYLFKGDTIRGKKMAGEIIKMKVKIGSDEVFRIKKHAEDVLSH